MSRPLSDKQLQYKLNKLAELSREIDTEVRERWPDGFIFAEADGGLHIMLGDTDRGGSAARQKFIAFTASTFHHIDSGAW